MPYPPPKDWNIQYERVVPYKDDKGELMLLCNVTYYPLKGNARVGTIEAVEVATGKQSQRIIIIIINKVLIALYIMLHKKDGCIK